MLTGNKQGECASCGTTILKLAEQGQITVEIKRIKSIGEGVFKFNLAFEDGGKVPIDVGQTIEYKTSFVDNTVIILADRTFLNRNSHILRFTVEKGVKQVYIELARPVLTWEVNGTGFSFIDIQKLGRKETKEINKRARQLALEQFNRF